MKRLGWLIASGKRAIGIRRTKAPARSLCRSQRRREKSHR